MEYGDRIMLKSKNNQCYEYGMYETWMATKCFDSYQIEIEQNKEIFHLKYVTATGKQGIYNEKIRHKKNNIPCLETVFTCLI